MHRLKPLFSDTTHFSTISNIQRCLRTVDFDEIGDKTHYLVFHMLGLFSFRQWSVQKTIDFWMSFLSHIDLLPDYVTIHPDKYKQWKNLYLSYKVDIKEDPECIWSDGQIGGYCTKFYKSDIEIGNIVNTLDTCIDVGFGGERILSLLGLLSPLTKQEILIETINCLLEEKVSIKHSGPGFILKKLITEVFYMGATHDSAEFSQVSKSLTQKIDFFLSNKDKRKFSDKSAQWWKDTHGLEISKILRK